MRSKKNTVSSLSVILRYLSNMNERSINYWKIGEETINQIKLLNEKPSLLLHSCCAPCATFPLLKLVETFDVTIYFNNDNIYPQEEYTKRLDELKHYLEVFNSENNQHVQLIVTPYDGKNYLDKISIRKDDHEGHARCRYCFYLRLNDAFAYANSHGYKYFTTVMTISRQKDTYAINRIGKVLQNRYKSTIFLFHNFKKNGGGEIGLKLAKKYNLYQQLYCGCYYSYKDAKKKDESNKIKSLV